VNEETVALDASLVQSDSQQLMAAGAEADPVALEAAVALYRGPFMAGFDLPGAPEYEAWQTQTARQIEAHYLALLEQLLAHHTATSNIPAAIRCAQRYLAVDELAEAMHRRLIGLYVAAGDRAAAQRQYEAVRAAAGARAGRQPAAGDPGGAARCTGAAQHGQPAGAAVAGAAADRTRRCVGAAAPGP
jgi:DNA-binding SARP family transcriptional activator